MTVTWNREKHNLGSRVGCIRQDTKNNVRLISWTHEGVNKQYVCCFSSIFQCFPIMTYMVRHWKIISHINKKCGVKVYQHNKFKIRATFCKHLTVMRSLPILKLVLWSAWLMVGKRLLKGGLMLVNSVHISYLILTFMTVTGKILGKGKLEIKQEIKNGGTLHGCSPFFIYAAHLRQDFMNKIRW